jgi:hypothetical protein
MSDQSALELTIAAVLAGLGVWLYRRPSPEPDGYGSQGAVLLIVIAIILGAHGWGLLRYHPTALEVEASRQ